VLGSLAVTDKNQKNLHFSVTVTTLHTPCVQALHARVSWPVVFESRVYPPTNDIGLIIASESVEKLGEGDVRFVNPFQRVRPSLDFGSRDSLRE
jgi:hypothetical protein